MKENEKVKCEDRLGACNLQQVVKIMFCLFPILVEAKKWRQLFFNMLRMQGLDGKIEAVEPKEKP